MSWKSGTCVLWDSWAVIRPFIKEVHRRDALLKLMEVFENYDWDCQHNVVREEWPESQTAFDKWEKMQEEE